MTRDKTLDAGMRRGAQSERMRLSGGVGVGNIQVDRVLCQERSCGVGITERCYKEDRY